MPTDRATPDTKARSVTVFGGTGKTGRHLVRLALDAGHRVTVLARTPAKLDLEHERLHVLQGDIGDPAAVATAVQGADAVLSVLGPTRNTDE
jgi:uncharacterized protein